MSILGFNDRLTACPVCESESTVIARYGKRYLGMCAFCWAQGDESETVEGAIESWNGGAVREFRDQ